MGLIWSLIVGAIIGAIAGAITNRGAAMGWIANIVAGLVGAWIGQGLLAPGPIVSWHGASASIIGAVVLVLIVSLIFGRTSRS